jgi:glutathionylspermidine synthase
MHRIRVAQRENWRQRQESSGFHWHSPGGAAYWTEDAAWVFSLKQIEEDIEAPTAEIEAMCLAFVKRAVTDERLLRQLSIPEGQWNFIAESWRRGDRNLYGRLDLAYDGTGPAKLLEYNADTPTSLVETAVAQWLWLEDGLAAGALPAGADQFNSVHEKLIAAFKGLRDDQPYRLHLAQSAGAPEDEGTVDYLQECANQAGVPTHRVAMHEIGLTTDGTFADAANRRIDVLFKLYPWEWMFREQFGAALSRAPVQFIEPPWKAILSNKGLLPLLWEMAPGHPNLLRTFFSDSPRAASLGSSFVEKPLLSREGANVTLHTRKGPILATDGPYGGERTVRQEVGRLATGDGGHVVVGSWLVASQPAGMGLREDDSLITKDTARFVPHVIVD